MKYMLDTNICVYIMKKKPVRALEKFSLCDAGDICISSITLAELEFGVCKSSSPLKNKFALTMFLSGIEVVSFDRKAAAEYGNIRADLEKQGKPIGGNDFLIAAHARSLNLTLVTNNVKEFCRVKDLKIENWA
ncbi:MAG: type II toxin-antitoxin system VapC family toxin [Selenomonadaceae bacterium]|nr:type II toxin-antitoxin system VapC family toxin [Selenomonadaceae bacterium]